MSENLKLKSISELIKFTSEQIEVNQFFIPSYQRGYRWGEQQVKDLLDDIYEFANSHKTKDEFYCLQPIVSTKYKNSEKYRVIDGQQRLTTIYIILKYYKNIAKKYEQIKNEHKEILEFCDIDNFNIEESYSIEYETRKSEKYDSRKFLENNLSKGIDDSNPDFYYMSKAYETIKQWFRTKQKKLFFDTLLKDVKVIWYQVECRNIDEEIEIFTRLNIGKIQLTNAELIKAMLLIPTKGNKEQIEFSSIWDNIEQALQKDAFWYFLKNSIKSETAIDLIFQVLAQSYKVEYNEYIEKEYKEDEEKESKKITLVETDDKFSYYIFAHILKTDFKTEKKIWQDARAMYRDFLNWFNDRETYHKVGYLVWFKESLLKIHKLYKDKSKDKFKSELNDLIKEKVKEINLVDLKYEYEEIDKNKIKNHKEKIHNILLLFNIETILQNNNSNMKFNFFNFKFIKQDNGTNKNREWDIEHIASQTDNLNKEKWIDTVLKYIDWEKISDEEKKKLIKNEEEFENFQNEIREKLGIKDIESNKHNIGNLTLLDSKTNRSYGNAFFPVKRAIIIKEDAKANFIPPSTKNVFLKQYSNKLSDMMNWNDEDIKSYRKKIFELLKIYDVTNEDVNDDK